ncbi:MAG: type 1 glutamine amidotransferase [Candidatus Caenarcaniphilales bacterium]|nr:type 1 glutamine amidotransferase [Candidatus Caenarcaniphilales bacterium]
MKIQILKHVAFEGPANIRGWAKSKNYHLNEINLWEDDLDSNADLDLLIVMGGPMGAYDDEKYPWMKPEKEFIKKQIEKGKKVLGICLGAQIIAEVLGAKVYKNKQKEIGWFPVKLTESALSKKFFKDFPTEFMAFHWHGDTYDIPAECDLLASSEACKNQAFSFEERVFGFQFHLESNQKSIQLLLDHCSGELIGGEYIQTPERILDGYIHLENLENNLNSFLSSFSHNHY